MLGLPCKYILYISVVYLEKALLLIKSLLTEYHPLPFSYLWWHLEQKLRILWNKVVAFQSQG